MARTIKGPFATEAEAEAFVQGVEYVNDGDYLQVKGIVSKKARLAYGTEMTWFVNLDDEDSSDEQRLELIKNVWTVVSE